MKKRYFVGLAFCLAGAVLMILVAGCGGGGGGTAASSGERGVEAVGALTAGNRAAVRTVSSDWGNPSYPDVYIVPSQYSVAVSKLGLLKSENDTDPYVVFDTGSVDNPTIIDMTGDGATATLGNNTDYPPAGTYTHVRMTLVYLDAILPVDIGDSTGYGPHNIRIYASSTGDIQDGDVIVNRDGVWQWIFGDQFYDITDSRPGPTEQDPYGEVVQDVFFGGTESADPFVATYQLPQPVVVPANPDGQYVITANFDVTQSPEIAGSQGTFIFDDVTQDGEFRPAVLPAQGGDCMYDEVNHQDLNHWSPLPPTISMSCTKQ